MSINLCHYKNKKIKNERKEVAILLMLSNITNDIQKIKLKSVLNYKM